jgi:hypothetical protein
MMFGRSTILKASIMRIRSTVTATGMICGQMISRKIWTLEAPSTWAASTWSRDTFSSAASMQMKMKGIHCQESQIIMTNRDAHGSTDQTHVLTVAAPKTGWNGPLVISATIFMA